jgi:hypothetical protein
VALEDLTDDNSSPGTNKLAGTDENGNKGWQDANSISPSIILYSAEGGVKPNEYDPTYVGPTDGRLQMAFNTNTGEKWFWVEGYGWW